MNTNIKCLAFVCVAFIGNACVTKEIEELSANVSESVEITITAVREGYNPDTRTVRESDGSVEWCPLDEISVFYTETANGGSKFTSQNTEQTAIAEFKGKLDGFIAGGEEFTNGKYLYGVYPYSSNTSFKDGVTTISLPSRQTAAEGTFSNGLFPTIARAQGVNLAFYNICGGVKFTVSRDDITSVTFKGNNDERLAGSAKVIFDDTSKPAVLDDEVESKGEITVYAPAGGTFEAGKEYYIVAYPVKLTSGFTMTFRTSEMKEGKYVSNSAVEIQRSVFGVVSQTDKNVTSWSDIASNGGGDNSGIYLGIIGFNQQLYSYPIEELTNVSKPGFDSFTDDLNMKNGTLLYYSVDRAITNMQSATFPANLDKVAIVTFTDGLDQGSMMMNSTYGTNDAYLEAIHTRLTQEKVSGQKIYAYSIGVRGNDVNDITQFQNNLRLLASDPDENNQSYSYEVSSMSEVNAKFKEIAEQLTQSNYVQTINLKMPGVSDGTLVRFTFDNVNSAEKSELYIEGIFNLTTRSLEYVGYNGLTSTSGTTIKGVVDGIFVTFTFEGVHTKDNKLIDSKFTDEWTYIASNNTWQINSEFDKTENSDIVTERNSAAIMLVLDCSSSLANDFATAQNNAKDFINTLYEAVGGSGENPGESSDNSIYSTIPKDLTLAIWKDSTRYYLTKDDYAKANLSDAVIEGLAIVSGGESFILSLYDVQTDQIFSITTAKTLYGDILPSADQGKIISAKWSDINNAISKFGGVKLDVNRYYYTSSTSSSSNRSFTSCIRGAGGVLIDTDSYPYVRGVKPVDYDSAIYWTDPDDLKLSVLIDGNREFLALHEYNDRKGEVETVEGISVIAGGEKFAIHLGDAQTDPISSITTAKTLYGDILPSVDQGKIISAKWSDINNAISKFGGVKLDANRYYYTSSTSSSSNRSFASCIGWSGGFLRDTDSNPYVRGVTNIE